MKPGRRSKRELRAVRARVDFNVALTRGLTNRLPPPSRPQGDDLSLAEIAGLVRLLRASRAPDLCTSCRRRSPKRLCAPCMVQGKGGVPLCRRAACRAAHLQSAHAEALR